MLGNSDPWPQEGIQKENSTSPKNGKETLYISGWGMGMIKQQTFKTAIKMSTTVAGSEKRKITCSLVGFSIILSFSHNQWR